MECNVCGKKGIKENERNGDLMDLVVFRFLLEKARIDEVLISIIFEKLKLEGNLKKYCICFECREKVYNSIKKHHAKIGTVLKNEFKL